MHIQIPPENMSPLSFAHLLMSTFLNFCIEGLRDEGRIFSS